MTDHQPCWKCARATGGKDCAWADRLEPVQGWIAIPDGDSYTIMYCPLYKADKQED